MAATGSEEEGAGGNVRGWVPRDPAQLFITARDVVGRGFRVPTIPATVPYGAETARVVRIWGRVTVEHATIDLLLFQSIAARSSIALE